MSWSIRIDKSNELVEPLQHDQLLHWLATGHFGPEDWARNGDDQEWKQLGEFGEFEAYFARHMRKRRLVEEDDSAMDMTPMIDVTFLLLIFFMITATFHLQKGLDFPPQESQDEKGAKQPAPGLSRFADRILITIAEDDSFTVKGSASAVAGGDQVAPDNLPQVLTDVSRDQKKNRVLILAHDLASNEAVVKAIDSAAQAGIRDVAVGDVSRAGAKKAVSSTGSRSP